MGIFDNDIPAYENEDVLQPSLMDTYGAEISQPIVWSEGDTPGGFLGVRTPGNSYPVNPEAPKSDTSYVSDLLNKAIGSFIPSMTNRLARNTQPSDPRGGKTQNTVGVLNPVPANWLDYPFASTAQPNPNLPGPWSSKSGMVFALFAVVLVFLLVRR